MHTPRLTATATALAMVLACAPGASAGSPVSDQYQSAPVPLVQGRATSSHAGSTSNAATGSSAAPQATSAGPVAGSAGTASKASAKPVVVTRVATAGTNAAEPVSAPSSDVPVLAITALGLLVGALALAAVGRARRDAATP